MADYTDAEWDAMAAEAGYEPTTTTTGNPTTTGSSGFWGVLGNIIGAGTGVYTTIANTNAQQNAASNSVRLQQAQLAAQANQSSSLAKMLPWIIGGVVVIALAFGALAIFKRGK